MCVQITLNIEKNMLIEHFNLPRQLEINFGKHIDYFPARAASDSQLLAVRQIPDGLRAEFLRWDLVPAWWKKPLAEKKFPTFNARGESVTEKPAFRSAWQKGQRCVMPANAFWEWPDKNKVSGKRVQKKVTIKNQPLFSLGGLWDYNPALDLMSCTVITVAGNAAMQTIPHNRMPIIIPPEKVGWWLDPNTDPQEAYSLVGDNLGPEAFVIE